MVHTTVNVHLRASDAGVIRASDPLETGRPTIVLGEDVAIFPGHGTDETALVLAAIRKACEDALAMLPVTPQPGAGAEYGMEAERG